MTMSAAGLAVALAVWLRHTLSQNLMPFVLHAAMVQKIG
jgi:hypothetical protein